MLLEITLWAFIALLIGSGATTVYFYLENRKASAHSTRDIETGMYAVIGAIAFLISSAVIGMLSWLA